MEVMINWKEYKLAPIKEEFKEKLKFKVWDYAVAEHETYTDYIKIIEVTIDEDEDEENLYNWESEDLYRLPTKEELEIYFK